MRVIDHPESFMSGTRVLLLTSRHKDGVEKERVVLRVSHSEEYFRRELRDLISIMRQTERIYATAGARDLAKASRLLKERQLANDYDADPMAFYRVLHSRWAACLMDTKAQADKVWLFDCDTSGDADDARAEIAMHYDRETPPYSYKSKSGEHIIVSPFDKSRLSDGVRGLLQENAIMLWVVS